MQEIKQKESLGDELCEYCHADSRIRLYDSGCEGRFCDTAYENYIDDMEIEEGE